MNIKEKIKKLPKTSGVYLYRNKAGKVIYVGKAVNLKNRVSSYFNKTDHPTSQTVHRPSDTKTEELIKNIADLEWLEVGSEFEALVLEADLIKRYKPKYNIRFRDDKNYIYLKISQEPYPRFSIVHQITDHEAKYLGPFVEAIAVRAILKLVRKIFPYCTCGLPKDEICLYFHFGLCKGHGPKYISENDYSKNIKGMIGLFSGKTEKLENKFKKEMDKAAKKKKYEEAAIWRDKLHQLIRIKKAHLFSDIEPSGDIALETLAEYLRLESLPKRIECFDISNIMGTATTGSMVVFKNGIAVPREYRRFQIKTVKSSDDFASMAEILSRRFRLSEIKKKDESFRAVPDLIILDGGKGQLSAVLNQVKIPDGMKVVALAKKLEQIIMVENIKSMSKTQRLGGDHLRFRNLDLNGNLKFKIVNLPNGSEALFLVQRIRDEAHRFAITYHRKLNSVDLFRSSLDAIVGVGPKTKKKLISEFGSISKIKAAKISDLERVVGLKVAQKIKEGL